MHGRESETWKALVVFPGGASCNKVSQTVYMNSCDFPLWLARAKVERTALILAVWTGIQATFDRMISGLLESV